MRRCRSPQARGSTALDPLPHRAHQPIPAGAGLNRSHSIGMTSDGSDPRRRGAQPSLSGFARQVESRSIPAGAGLNRRYQASLAKWRADRSPQARGSTAPASRQRVMMRPIPAGAGLNRGRAMWRCGCDSDPRRRGAQPTFKWTNPPSDGRSPQARGSTVKLGEIWHRRDPIPAGAGLNRPRQSNRDKRRSDPRRRGAQPADVPVVRKVTGRSPQARGSTALKKPARFKHEPIPAGAGLNRMKGPKDKRASADPRRRGAQPFISCLLMKPPARSPQARGSTANQGVPAAERFPIPAGAGLNRP